MVGICEASGEIDRATAPEFIAAMCAAIDSADTRTVVVDCTDVSFIDSGGYHALIGAQEYARAQGHTLVVSHLLPHCAKVLRLCDSAHDLTLVP
jgi:anti-anti-sigma factor